VLDVRIVYNGYIINLTHYNMRTGISTRVFFLGVLAIGIFAASTIALAAIVSGNSTTAQSMNVTITQLTIGRPATSTVGDLLLAAVATKDGSNSTVTPPAGWNLILRTDNATHVSILTYWKVVGASEPSSYTWTLTPTTNAIGGITAYTGVDTSNPVDVSSGNTGRSATAIASSITTTIANDQVVTAFAVPPGATAFSTPASTTEKYDTAKTPNGPSIASDDVAQASAGASGSKSSTISSGTAQWAAQQIALRTSIPISLPNCVGGAITTSGGRTIHTFTSNGTLDCTASGGKIIDVLVVGGGGGGGGAGTNQLSGGGGGAGGYEAHTSLAINASAYNVTIGAGGLGGATYTTGNAGNDSIFDSIVAKGGGGGGAWAAPTTGAPTSGGSGGGGGVNSSSLDDAHGAAALDSQGFAGGNGEYLFPISSPSAAGGGGGAGTTGVDASSGTGGDGGAGMTNSISGASTTYAGGGAGPGSASSGSGGSGGGASAPSVDGNGNNGAANTGGGGSGARSVGSGSFTGGSGGSGVVIISYPTP
jgi:hypothetical protein